VIYGLTFGHPSCHQPCQKEVDRAGCGWGGGSSFRDGDGWQDGCCSRVGRIGGFQR